MAFRGLQAESAAQGVLHQSVAKDLQTLVADPFELWARGYKVRPSNAIWAARLFLIEPRTGATQATESQYNR